MADENIKIGIDVSQVVSGAKQGAAAIKQMGEQAKQSGKAVKDAMDVANMSFGEMRKELRALNQMSFSGLKPEEIKKIKDRVAELTEGIRDFREQTRTASESGIPGMIAGLRGIVSMGQAVTSTLALFGVENEKLEKSMIQLIGAAQALATVEDLYGKKTLQVAIAQTKNTAAKAANAVTTKVLTAATQGATVAQKALNVAILAAPYVAAAAAIAAIGYALVRMATNAQEAEMAYNAWAGKARDTMDDLKKSTERYNKIFETVNIKIQEYNERNLSDGEKLKRQYLAEAEIRKQQISGLIALLMVKQQLVAQEVQQAKAQYEWMRWLMPEQAAIMLKGIEDLSDQQAELTNQVNIATDGFKKYVASIDQIADKIRNNVDAVNSAVKAEADLEAARKKAMDEEKKRRQEQAANHIKAFGERQAILELAEKAFRTESDAAKKQTEREIDKFAALNEILNKKEEAEKQYTQSKLDRLNEEFKAGEVGWTEYYDRIKEIEDEAYQERIENITKFIAVSSEMLSEFGEITANIKQIETNKFNEQAEIETAKLEEEYENRLNATANNAYQRKLVEEWYKNEKAKLDEETTAKSIEIQKKYKIVEQSNAIGTALMNGALAITEIWAKWAEFPPVAAALTALVAGVTATQVGVIASQKFEKGGTGVIEGKSHVSGGVKFFGGEAESDERWAIFNREATLRNTGLADLIDAVNGHQLIIDNNFMKRLNGDGNNIVVMSNFNGGEHLAGMHEIMKRNEGRDIYLPDGRIKRGIIKRRYN